MKRGECTLNAALWFTVLASTSLPLGLAVAATAVPPQSLGVTHAAPTGGESPDGFAARPVLSPNTTASTIAPIPHDEQAPGTAAPPSVQVAPPAGADTAPGSSAAGGGSTTTSTVAPSQPPPASPAENSPAPPSPRAAALADGNTMTSPGAAPSVNSNALTVAPPPAAMDSNVSTAPPAPATAVNSNAFTAAPSAVVNSNSLVAAPPATALDGNAAMPASSAVASDGNGLSGQGVAGAANSRPAGATADGTASSPPVDASYIKLREIQERVNRLKEQVFQSKARLVQLQEVVLHGSMAGAKLVLNHKNEMGSSFKLSHVQYALDGTVIFNRTDADAPDLDKQESIEVFNGPVAPGNHQLAVYLEYVGNGFGLFSYLDGYHFKIKSSRTLLIDEGKLTTVDIVGFEKGGITTELKDRPSVRFDVEAPVELRSNNAKSGAPSAPSS